ncbi:MAG TPA: hypothetical protein VK579_07500, partial [Terriglobales bacterium]|nr:hypothetical protein [Terriglobales bacterium]
MMGFADGSTHPTDYKVHTRPRVQRASGVPHALFGREIQQSLGRMAGRERKAVFAIPRHCERSEAIHLAARRKNGLLRCARNDEAGRQVRATKIARPANHPKKHGPPA